MKRIKFAGEELAKQKSLDESTKGIVITDENCTSQEIVDALNLELVKFKNGEHHNPIYYLGNWRTPSGKVYIPLYFHTTSSLQVLKIQSALHFDASTYYSNVRYAHVYSLRMNMDDTGEAIRNIVRIETNDIAFGKDSGGSFIMSTGNTVPYTPKNDYNPATKKYVDDAISNIENTGSSSENSVNEIINSEAFSVEVPANGDSESFTLNEEFKNKLVDFINKLLSNNISIGIVTSYCRINFTEYPIQFVICTDYISNNTSIQINGTPIPVRFNTGKISVVAHTTLVLSYTYDSETNQITYDYQNNWCMFDNFISTNNTYAYTPTEDYHPATKKYVDDLIPKVSSKEELSDLINRVKYKDGNGWYSDILFAYCNSDGEVLSYFKFYDFDLSNCSNRGIGGIGYMKKIGNDIFIRSYGLNINTSIDENDVITVTSVSLTSDNSTYLASTTTLDSTKKSILANIAPTYSTTSTYEVGDYVTNGSYLYKCITAVDTAEAFDSAKWEQTTVAEMIKG